MPKLYRLPRFHSNLVYQRPSNISNIEALRNICPSLYYEEEDDKENHPFATTNTYKENVYCKSLENVNTLKTNNRQDSITNSNESSNNNKRPSSIEFSRQLADLQDYGSETRDYIISRLERSFYNKVVSKNCDTQQPNQPSCSSQAYVEPKKGNNSNNLSLKSDDSRTNLKVADSALKTPQIELVTTPKSPTRSRLPMLVKDYKRKQTSAFKMQEHCSVKTSEMSSFPMLNSREKSSLYEKPQSVRKISRPSTKWFKENKLTFTKKSTSYAFVQYDINGDKNLKINNNTVLFGHSSGC